MRKQNKRGERKDRSLPPPLCSNLIRGKNMSQRLDQTCKHCETKKDKPRSAWQVVHTKTGKTLRHIKVDGKGIAFAGVEWSNLSAFAWVEDGTKVVPHFNEQGAKDMLKLYTEQTGDSDAQVIKIMVA